MAISIWQRSLPAWGFSLVVVLLFASGVLFRMFSGHWETSLTYNDYQRLIPLAERLGH